MGIDKNTLDVIFSKPSLLFSSLQHDTTTNLSITSFLLHHLLMIIHHLLTFNSEKSKKEGKLKP
jgi:hypothetical protein